MIHFDVNQSEPVRFRKRPNHIKRAVTTLCVVCFICWFYVHSNWPDTYVHLTMCDVGQGDAILIHQGFRQVLIDSSQDERVLDCLARNLPPWDHELDLVLITHFDRDHVGGLVSVLEVYRTRVLITPVPSPGFTEENPEILKRVTTATTKGMEWKQPILGQQINLGFRSPEGILEILLALPGGSLTNQEWSDNNQSIVTLLHLEQITTLLTGDLEEPGEQELLKRSVLAPVNILKVGHHGSKTSTTVNLLEKIRPQLALISVGRKNSYGHPAPGTLAKLAKYGVKVLVTAEIGEIDIVTNGKSYWQAKPEF